MQRSTRRSFLGGASALALETHPLLARALRSGREQLLLVGTQTTQPSSSRGIYAYRFNSDAGELTQIDLAVETENPTFLAVGPRGKFVCSVNEVSPGTVSSFALDKNAMKLSRLSKISTNGGGPTHIAIDHTGRCIFAANYGGGSVASFRANSDGQLSEAVSFFQYTADGQKNERKPHAHRVTVSPDKIGRAHV